MFRCVVTSLVHCELVIVDGDRSESGRILNGLGDRRAAGNHFVAGDSLLDAAGSVESGSMIELAAVHASYLQTGLCAVWPAYYGWRRIAPPTLNVLQVVRPPSCYCEHHGANRMDLAIAGAAMTVPGPNRAAGRRQARGR